MNHGWARVRDAAVYFAFVASVTPGCGGIARVGSTGPESGGAIAETGGSSIVETGGRTPRASGGTPSAGGSEAGGGGFGNFAGAPFGGGFAGAGGDVFGTGGFGAFAGGGAGGFGAFAGGGAGGLGTGGVDCGGVDCAFPICTEDEQRTTLPGQCCPTCEPCGPCPNLPCAPGQIQVDTGMCCGTCAPASCPDLEMEYYSFRSGLVSPEASACNTNSDCVGVPYMNPCDPSTCQLVGNVDSVKPIIVALDNYAAQIGCANVCITPPGLCGSLPAVGCVAGTCSPLLPPLTE